MKIDIKPRYGIMIVLFLLLAFYALYQARALLIGPQIWITSPRDGQTVENSLVTIEGRAKNIAWMSLNDRPIFTDENGLWSEKLAVSEGISIMTLKARDRFGREIEERVRIRSKLMIPQTSHKKHV
jgi:hypothetical protein